MVQRLQATEPNMKKKSIIGMSKKGRKRITWIRSLVKVFNDIEKIKRLKEKASMHITRRQDSK